MTSFATNSLSTSDVIDLISCSTDSESDVLSNSKEILRRRKKKRISNPPPRSSTQLSTTNSQSTGEGDGKRTLLSSVNRPRLSANNIASGSSTSIIDLVTDPSKRGTGKIRASNGVSSEPRRSSIPLPANIANLRDENGRRIFNTPVPLPSNIKPIVVKDEALDTAHAFSHDAPKRELTVGLSKSLRQSSTSSLSVDTTESSKQSISGSQKRYVDGRFKRNTITTNDADIVQIIDSNNQTKERRHSSEPDAKHVRVSEVISRANLAQPERKPASGRIEQIEHVQQANKVHGIAKSERLAQYETWKSLPDAKGQPFSPEEDERIILLKESEGMGWKELRQYFPGRSEGALSTRYCNKLHPRHRQPRSKTQSRKDLGSRKSDTKLELLGSGVNSQAQNRLRKRSTRSSLSSEIVHTLKTNIRTSDMQLHKKDCFSSSRGVSPANVNSPNSFNSHPTRTREAILPNLSFGESFWEESDDVKEEERDRRAMPISVTAQGPHLNQVRDEVSFRSDPQKENKTQPEFLDPTTRPYLSYHERQALRNGFDRATWDRSKLVQWGGTKVHVDFDDSELALVEVSAAAIIRPKCHPKVYSALGRLQNMLRQATAAHINGIVWHLSTEADLGCRSRKSIESFLRDVTEGYANVSPVIHKIGPPRRHLFEDESHGGGRASLLRHREIGQRGRRSWESTTNRPSRAFMNDAYDSMGPTLSFTGTSGDVTSVAWSPDGCAFAAGSACLVDTGSMQYNRPNNLLLGNRHNKTLIELPDHHVIRERPESGVNSTEAMHISQDPQLFMTVSMVDFSNDGKYMFSAGYDEMVRIWDVSSGNDTVSCAFTLKHKAPVDLLAVSPGGILATGCRRVGQNSIKLVRIRPDKAKLVGSFTSRKAVEKPQYKLSPSCLRWGTTHYTSKYLLAGFCSDTTDTVNDMYGEVCLWDAETSQPLSVLPKMGNCFDAVWDPYEFAVPSFAVATVANIHSNRGIKSVIKLYSQQSLDKFRGMMELECPALDMNDVVFNPYDPNIISAGCTDGVSYIWDIRRPDYILHKLQHGDPLIELEESSSRENVDTGIRFLSWQADRTRLFSGSSDGVVKSWDIYRSAEDVLVKNVVSLNSGVMCGAFSPDFSSLLLGEVNGSINVLEVGHEDKTLHDMEDFTFTAALPPSVEDSPSAPSDEGSGIALAAQLLASKQLELRPMGAIPIRQAVQGPAYNGPYDEAMDAPDLHDKAYLFQRKLWKSEVPTDPCPLPTCRDNLGKFAVEDVGDSGRSCDRIPSILRSSRLKDPKDASRQKKMAGRVGEAKCSECGATARPRDTGVGDDVALILCERCSFDCFRCGGRASVSDAVDEIECMGCESRWRADVLGYSVVERPGRGKEKIEWGVFEKERVRGECLDTGDGTDQEGGGDLLELVEGYIDTLATN
ncbi:WD40 repeat-like protein [Patellaria atrata CBS 101060]|uniref:WD40 repeat-like protein n=1 Tax=Patellaria atrata CBS 101060 TaxID=1346257 RepID=A0A9P4SER5_9PEZI|nr:WD40 repeat-like protein [Patellaria atrata CBS 101060]